MARTPRFATIHSNPSRSSIPVSFSKLSNFQNKITLHPPFIERLSRLHYYKHWPFISKPVIHRFNPRLFHHLGENNPWIHENEEDRERRGSFAPRSTALSQFLIHRKSMAMANAVETCRRCERWDPRTGTYRLSIPSISFSSIPFSRLIILPADRNFSGDHLEIICSSINAGTHHSARSNYFSFGRMYFLYKYIYNIRKRCWKFCQDL